MRKNVFRSALRFIVFSIALLATLPFCYGQSQSESAKKEGPKVISKAVVPLPPYLYETSEGQLGENPETSSEKKPNEIVSEESCATFDDSICTMKCNPPIQDVGERCAQYEKRPDGVCICKTCEIVECGGGKGG